MKLEIKQERKIRKREKPKANKRIQSPQPPPGPRPPEGQPNTPSSPSSLFTQPPWTQSVRPRRRWPRGSHPAAPRRLQDLPRGAPNPRSPPLPALAPLPLGFPRARATVTVLIVFFVVTVSTGQRSSFQGLQETRLRPPLHMRGQVRAEGPRSSPTDVVLKPGRPCSAADSSRPNLPRPPRPRYRPPL